MIDIRLQCPEGLFLLLQKFYRNKQNVETLR